MKKEIDPKVGFGIGGAILLLLILVGYFALNRGPAKIDVSNVPVAERADADPIHPGQPGYRERITDPPAPGGTPAQSSRN